MTLVTLLSIAATNIKYTPGTAGETVIAVAMDHRGGAPLLGFADMQADFADGSVSRLLVEVDGAPVFDKTYPMVRADGAETSLAYEQIEVDPGQHEIRVSLFDRVDRTAAIVVFDDVVGLTEGEIFNVAINDAQVADEAGAGRSLFAEGTLGTNTGCRLCHSLDAGTVLVGPSLSGVATRAASRVPGLTAEQYLRQSIIDPNAYIVDGFPAGQMFNNYGQVLSAEEIDSLVAFLLTQE